MKVLYDHQIFTHQRFGGISRYFYELIKNLDSDVDYKLPLIYSDNQYLANRNISNHLSIHPDHHSGTKTRRAIKLNNLALKLCKKSDVDLVHPTYYTPKFLKYTKEIPFVVTVYDMIHEKYAELFKDDLTTSVFKRKLCDKATKIIAISENTKTDLIDLFNISPNKIDVIYLGQSFKPTDEKTLSLPERYILFTGQRWGYKNFTRTAQAFAQLLRDDSELKLICTGSTFTNEELSLFARLGITGSVIHIYATDSQLAELYRDALLFVFPSEYEGFGIPVLEAFACKCPIALSRASCFPEVAGDAGLYFDPLSVDDITHTIGQLINNQELKDDLVEKGSTQLNKFSWENMAHETSLLYKNI